MSRTYRALKPDSHWRYWRRPDTINDNFTESVRPFEDSWHTVEIRVDRQKEPKKWKKLWWKAHRESKYPNYNSPGHCYRNRNEAKHRMDVKTELSKFIKNPEHDVIINKPSSAWWDWL